ncbi:coronin 2B [Phyllostomus discolor]|uniref:Coronin 2B n=1 Tax=Phyllostomus discolor TaxID=89673 RepID=A0A834BKN9_9CHIR|nr:coronin 2B [Phyllostomus discolor]
MSWRPQYRSSKFRNVYGKVANREHCFDGIPITKNVHDNHFCAVNARFLAIVTESAGGGSFLVIPLEQVFLLCGCLREYSKSDLQSLDHDILRLCHSGTVPRGLWEVTRLRKSARCQSCLFMAELFF